MVEIIKATSHDIARAERRTREYIADHIAESTKRAYATDYERFLHFCQHAGLEAMPASAHTVAMHIAMLADSGYTIGSIRRAISGIAKAHEVQGYDSPRKHPAVRYALQGVARRIGDRPRQVDALSPQDILQMLNAIAGEDLRSLRNQAMLTTGFAGAFRRSELVALNIEDLTATNHGYRVLIRRSKTDQTGKGREVGIPKGEYPKTCPVSALNRWIAVSGITSGPLFCGISRKGNQILPGHRLSPRTVARTVQKAAELAGLDGWFAGHSLRAGLVTTAARAGKPAHVIQDQTGHKSIDMIMRYIRREGLFEENAASGIGL